MLPRLLWMLAMIAAPLVAATTSPQSLAWPEVERDTKPTAVQILRPWRLSPWHQLEKRGLS